MATFAAKHDHTLMDVLLEDLSALVEHCLASPEPCFLEDTRQLWKTLHTEFSHHMHMEDGFFRQLEQQFPHLSTVLETLTHQHLRIVSMLEAFGEMLLGPFEQVVERRESLGQRWQELGTLWNEHSHSEWEMMTSLRGLTAQS